MVRGILILHILAYKSRAVVVAAYFSLVANVHLKKFASLKTIRVRFCTV